jgi:hypothetical protein
MYVNHRGSTPVADADETVEIEAVNLRPGYVVLGVSAPNGALRKVMRTVQSIEVGTDYTTISWEGGGKSYWPVGRVVDVVASDVEF